VASYWWQVVSSRDFANVLAHEYQCAGTDAATLAAVARHVAACIDDPREREAFLDTATMSGLVLS
jgi:hypothetical protein